MEEIKPTSRAAMRPHIPPDIARLDDAFFNNKLEVQEITRR
jgi:hypothetical protein